MDVVELQMSRSPVQYERSGTGIDHEVRPQQVTMVQMAAGQPLEMLHDLELRADHLDSWKGKLKNGLND